LKVCTFNAKCDELDYKCCIKDTCYRDECEKPNSLPDSLVAAMMSVALMGTHKKADIYNIQNVKNKCVVEHLLKELCRVKTITDKADVNNDLSLRDTACRLNAFEGLCKDARHVKDALAACGKYKLDYVNLDCDGENTNSVFKEVYKYLNVPEYVAYFDNTSLTLVRKDLCLSPEVKTIPCVDSLVLFFEHCNRKLINVNVDLGGLVNSLKEYGCRKAKVESVVNFLKQHKDCGAVIMAGAMGDFDYDVSQLFFAGDSLVSGTIQQLTSKGICPSVVPSDFPCDLCDPLYETMEFLIKTCNAEQIPYSWLLQYLRVKGCKKCCLYKLVNKCKPKKCVVPNVNDCMKCPVPSPCVSYTGKGRAHLRQKMSKRDKCETVCKDTCKVETKKCDDCNPSKCVIKCKEAYECKSRDNNKYVVKVDQCKDLCEKKSCCGSCSKSKKCESDDLCPPDPCEGFKYCDTVTVLKRDLCLSNTLSRVRDPNDRYTGFYNHFNRKLDCKYPRGMFQAWAMCEDYEKPCPTRVVDNNSELLALDHVLVSDCLKNYVVNVCMTDLCLEKCGKSVKELVMTNALSRIPVCADDATTTDCPTVPDYSGSLVKSFFTNRVYCVTFDFPSKRSTCDVSCGESLHALGLTSLWDAVCSYARCKYGLRESCEGVCVDVCVFADFWLDKHPYLRDFFWDCFEDKFSNKNKTVSEKLADCEDYNFMMCCSKRDYMCEHEFYEHMLCQLSKVDNRDRFVFIVACMQAIFKTARCNDAVSIDPAKVRALLRYLDSCFCDEVKVSGYIASLQKLLANFHANGGNKFPNVVENTGLVNILKDKLGSSVSCSESSSLDVLCSLLGLKSDDVVELLRILDNELASNCVVMELLSRYAVRVVDLEKCAGELAMKRRESGGVDKVKDAIKNIVGDFLHDSVNDDKDCVVEMLSDVSECKMTARDFVSKLLRCVVKENQVETMLCLIGMESLCEKVLFKLTPVAIS
jgi:hypothetical protein